MAHTQNIHVAEVAAEIDLKHALVSAINARE